jgi:serine/threonine protein kinase
MSLATRNKALSAQNSEAVLNEIQMARRLAQTSDHIIHMYDFDFDRLTGLSYIVMELGREDLEKYLSQRVALLPAERKEIWRQLVDIAVTLEVHLIVSRLGHQCIR